MERNRKGNLPLTLALIASTLVCVLLLLSSNSGCFLFERRSEDRNEDINGNRGVVDEYDYMLTMIKELYIGEFNESELHAEAMRALAESLDDWSFYMTAEEYEAFIYRANNQYTGIGVEVTIDEETGGMRIVGVFSGAPAELAGVLVGDVITHIDGHSVSGLTISEMRDLLARPIGDYAVLTVLGEDEDRAELFVMYAEVFVDPIKFDMIEGNIGYITINNFDAKSAEPFINAIEELLGLGASSFIYDVRANAGGRVSELTMMLDYLLPEGEIFVQIDRSGNEQVTTSDEEWLDVPAVVIVDRHSYSAAEYFAAILGEYEYAQVVGEQTTGKSRSQTTHKLPSGGALHISTGQYLTKNRVSLFDAGGLTPDYEVDLTDEEFALFITGSLDIDDDPQLQKAISLLQ